MLAQVHDYIISVKEEDYVIHLHPGYTLPAIAFLIFVIWWFIKRDK